MIINFIKHTKDGDIINYEEDSNLLIEPSLTKTYNLKADESFNLSELLVANEEFAYRKAKEYALNFISYAMRSEKQVYVYLRKKHIQKRAVENTIETLKSHNYLNDKDFAKFFCENMILSGKSKRYIAEKLREKGIDTEIIEEVTSEYDLEVQYDNTKRFLVSKNNSLKKYPPKIRKEKLFRSGLSHGYNQSMVSKIIDELLEDENENFDDFYTELIEKKLNSLAKKNYPTKEFRLKAYTYLLPKGVPKELIDEIIARYIDSDD